MSEDVDRLVGDLADSVFQVAGLLRANFDAAAAELGLPPVQAMALMNLDAPAPMRRLAEWLRCDASNVTGIVDGLERRGLVERRPDPGDRRVKHLVLTEEGERKRALLRDGRHAHAVALFDLPEAELTRLRDALRQVVSKAGPHPGCR
ncbi:MarR family winged helix-turn-helix transcriptional regulator [Actinomadura livida]|uniref:MarR family transcriptional regulator n=1 Tax=Actinomadura livida TaxID=79909 RepID=A0A7W7I9G2_9ACTN|nr:MULTISPECIES: MarR family winged helix-turn-helix transcriptional regulator [Actinomadura]MBB4772982.1 DNA-binding MarR family transcriptional regulator [Actinomadura catellatispora]GGU17254.1 MarR family transcriptional regulator [Actinomadura livida]